MKIVALFNLGEITGSAEFTGTSLTGQIPETNIRRVCDKNQYFFGQISNLSNIDIDLHLSLAGKTRMIHTHDLRAKESIDLQGIPLTQMGVMVNGTVLIHGMGIIIQAENPDDVREIILRSKMSESLHDFRYYGFPLSDHTDISSATTTTIADPAAGNTLRIYKITVSTQSAARLEIRSTDSNGTGNPNIIGTLNFAGEGSFVYDFGDRGLQCQNGEDGLLRIVSNNTAVLDIDVIYQDVDLQ